MDKAKVYLDKIKDFIKNLDKKKRTLYLTIVCICIALSVLIVCILNYTDYVVLYSGLESKECYSIIEELDTSSIDYKLKGDDTIYVSADDEPEVKLQLASQGYPQSALNYDIFTSNVDFMTTDYEKTEYSRMQLQERLQASIKTLDDVEDAIVTITIPDNSLAVLDDDKVEPSASTIITLARGITLTKNQISGVELLISRSVPNLKVESVSILDQTGAVLNNKEDDETLISTANKIQTETEISKLISDRIETVLAPVYGVSKLSIGVNVSLDYSNKVTEKTEYTPTTGNTGVINKYNQTYQGAGGDSAATGVPGTETNSEVTKYATVTDSGTNGSISNDVSVDYSVNELTEQVQKQGAEIADLTVSVLIDKKVMSNEEINEITGIIANASGISTDKVKLYNTEFTAANGEEDDSEQDSQNAESHSIISSLSTKQIMIIVIIILMLAVIFVPILVIKSKRKKRKLMEELDAEEDGVAAFIPDGVKNLQVAKITEITESKEQQITKEIRGFSSKAPQITASLLRTLLKGDLE